MSQSIRLVAGIAAVLAGRRLAELPAPIESEPLCNLLGAPSAIVHTSPDLRLERADGGVQFTALLETGHAAGTVSIGPASIPPSTGMLRFSCGLTLVGNPECRLSAEFAVAGTPREPVSVAFSSYAARVGDVCQDMFVPVPDAADSVTFELRIKRGEGEQSGVRLWRPCLTAAHAWPGPETPVDDALLFRQRFSRPDGSAEFVRGAPAAFPVWSCVLPTAHGKNGPGLHVVRAHDAEVFAVPGNWSGARGHVRFWLRPEWDAGDARPADMVRISQAGKPRLLVRKNHGWSFLFVVWDGEGKTHGASCSLRLLGRDRWSKVDAVWDSGKGLCLVVNGVALGRKDCTWAVPAPVPPAIRVGEGQHDKPERAPYVLDEIEIRTDVPEGLL